MCAAVIEVESKTHTHTRAAVTIAQQFPHSNKFSCHARTHSADFADTAVVQCRHHTKHYRRARTVSLLVVVLESILFVQIIFYFHFVENNLHFRAAKFLRLVPSVKRMKY